MKKSLLLFTLLVLCICGSAKAAVATVADLCGNYTFTATQVSATTEYDGIFPTSFEVSIEENVNVANGVIISGFAGSTEAMSGVVDVTAKTILIESMPAYSAANYAITFSNANGDYPYDYNNGYVSLTFTFDDDKNLSLDAYSIVTVDHSTTSATILAAFSNAKGTFAGSATPEVINFAGTYKASGSCYDYTTGVSSTLEFDIIVEAGSDANTYNVTAIAGYSNTTVTATAEGNVLSFNLGYNFLTTGATYDVLGDNSYASEYSTEYGLTITYNEGTYTMSDFSVWTATWSEAGTTYARKLYISNITISEGPAQGETPVQPTTVDFAGTYKATANCYDYTTSVYTEVFNFDLIIKAGSEENAYDVTAIAGYNPATMVYANADANVLTFNLGYNYLSATYDLLGDNSYANEYSIANGLTLTDNEGTLTMTDFSVWTATWTSEGTTYARKLYISNISLEKIADAVEEIVVDQNAPVEYYNLQGIKVNAENAKAGIYIKKQGNSTSKVFIR